MTKTAVATGDSWEDPRKKARLPKVTPMELDRWAVEINDAPIRCGRCGEPIVGSGQGTFGVLERLVKEHIRNCDKRGPVMPSRPSERPR